MGRDGEGQVSFRSAIYAACGRTRLYHELLRESQPAIRAQDGDGGNVPVRVLALGDVFFPAVVCQMRIMGIEVRCRSKMERRGCMR